MSIDDSTARGLTKRFKREVRSGQKRYRSKLSTLPINARPSARKKLVDGLVRSAGAAGAYAYENDDGFLSWAVWQWADIPHVGQGYSMARFVWPVGDGVRYVGQAGKGTLLTEHTVQRIAQAYLAAESDVSVTDLGEHLDTACYPLWTLEAANAIAVTDAMGDVWLCDQNGCALLGGNENGAPVIKTFIDVADWDLWRHQKWDRYLDDECNVLVADAKTGDLLNMLTRDELSEGARVGREVAKFNLDIRGIQHESRPNPTKH